MKSLVVLLALAATMAQAEPPLSKVHGAPKRLQGAKLL
jgi:hypothetical protein